MTGLDVPVGYGGEIRVGTVRVPDPRVDFLSGIYSPKKTTYATINLRDVPGEHGAGSRVLSPRTLQEIRDREALCLVLRDFLNPALEGDPDPLGDLRAFHDECVLADLAVVERRLDRARKERADVREIDAFETMTVAWRREEPCGCCRRLSCTGLHEGLRAAHGHAAALRGERGRGPCRRGTRPRPGRRNPGYGGRGNGSIGQRGGRNRQSGARGPTEFLEDLGLSEPVLARFIRTAYSLMDVVSFFTIGPDEVRAWTIRRGTVARAAAGCVHSDLERGFIRAEVIPYEVFAEYRSEQAVKEAGLMRVEGKDYVVADGELLHVRFNV